MAQIVKEPGAGEIIGSQFGTGLSSGLSQGLQLLMNQRMQDLAQRNLTQRLQQGLQPIFGEQAGAYSQLPESSINTLIKEKLREPSNQAYMQALGSILGGGTGTGTQGAALQPEQLGGLSADQATKLTQLALQQRQLQAQQQLAQSAAQEKTRQFEATQQEKKREFEEKQALAKQKVEEQAALKKQEVINAQNAPYLKQLDTAIQPARDIYNLASEMKALLNSGKVATGLYGRYAPKQIQNFETQSFDAKSNELAALIAGTGKGVATNYKIKLALMSKPMIDQRPETQLKLIEDAINKSGKVIKEDEARQQVIADNNGQQPANIKFKISEKIKEPAYASDLPDDVYDDGSVVAEGDIIESNGKQFERIQGRWNLIG